MSVHHYFLIPLIDPEFDETDDTLMFEHIARGEFLSVHPDAKSMNEKPFDSEGWHLGFFKTEPKQTAQPQEPEPSPLHPPPHISAPRKFPDREFFEMLGFMDLDKPLSPGSARVWTKYIMINADDLKEFKNDLIRDTWPIVWCGYGFMIFQRNTH